MDDEKEPHKNVLKLLPNVFQFPQISNHRHMNLILIIKDLVWNHQKVIDGHGTLIGGLHTLLTVPILNNYYT